MIDRKVLVTGANGFVGRHCLPILCRAGFSVYAICRHNSLSPMEGVTYIECDLKNKEEVAWLIRTIRPSHLLHLAWYVEPGKYSHSDENLDWVLASIHLVRQFVKYGGQRLVTVGSCSEYDWSCIPQNGCLSETTPLAYSETLYSAAKISLGSLMSAYMKEHGRLCTHARLFYLFGPGESEKRLVPQAVKTIRTGTPFILQNGNFVRDYLYVKDAALALCCVLNSSFEGPVNIASGKGCSLLKLLREVEDIVGVSGLVRCQESVSESTEPVCIIADIQKLHSLGWESQFTLSMALRDYLVSRKCNTGGLKCSI